MVLAQELDELQRALTDADPFHTRTLGSGNGSGISFLVYRLEQLKFKIYQEIQHATPHIHIDYGPSNHAASYRISPPSRLAGNIPTRYDKVVIDWISKHESKLLDVWQTVQSGQDPHGLVAMLQANH